MSISTLAARNGLDGQTLRKQYKEKISGYRNWDQLGHAGEYILFADNFGEDMSLDETCLSNGEVYTVLTNKAARGKKGALAAILRLMRIDLRWEVLARENEAIREHRAKRKAARTRQEKDLVGEFCGRNKGNEKG